MWEFIIGFLLGVYFWRCWTRPPDKGGAGGAEQQHHAATQGGAGAPPQHLLILQPEGQGLPGGDWAQA